MRADTTVARRLVLPVLATVIVLLPAAPALAEPDPSGSSTPNPIGLDIPQILHLTADLDLSHPRVTVRLPVVSPRSAAVVDRPAARSSSSPRPNARPRLDRSDAGTTTARPPVHRPATVRVRSQPDRAALASDALASDALASDALASDALVRDVSGRLRVGPGSRPAVAHGRNPAAHGIGGSVPAVVRQALRPGSPIFILVAIVLGYTIAVSVLVRLSSRRERRSRTRRRAQ